MNQTRIEYSVPFCYFLIQILAILPSISETAAADRAIQTHSLGPGFPNGFHDGIHVEVAFASGSWANTDSFIRHFHMNLKRQKFCIDRCSQQK